MLSAPVLSQLVGAAQNHSPRGLTWQARTCTQHQAQGRFSGMGRRVQEGDQLPLCHCCSSPVERPGPAVLQTHYELAPWLGLPGAAVAPVAGGASHGKGLAGVQSRCCHCPIGPFYFCLNFPDYEGFSVLLFPKFPNLKIPYLGDIPQP